MVESINPDYTGMGQQQSHEIPASCGAHEPCLLYKDTVQLIAKQLLNSSDLIFLILGRDNESGRGPGC